MGCCCLLPDNLEHNLNDVARKQSLPDTVVALSLISFAKSAQTYPLNKHLTCQTIQTRYSLWNRPLWSQMDRLLSFYCRRLLKVILNGRPNCAFILVRQCQILAKVATPDIYIGQMIHHVAQFHMFYSPVFSFYSWEMSVLEMGDMVELSVGSETFRDGADQGTVDLLGNQS